jgi:hypothetical protein
VELLALSLHQASQQQQQQQQQGARLAAGQLQPPSSAAPSSAPFPAGGAPWGPADGPGPETHPLRAAVGQMVKTGSFCRRVAGAGQLARAAQPALSRSPLALGPAARTAARARAAALLPSRPASHCCPLLTATCRTPTPTAGRSPSSTWACSCCRSTWSTRPSPTGRAAAASPRPAARPAPRAAPASTAAPRTPPPRSSSWAA